MAQTHDLCHPRLHRLRMRADFWEFADQSTVYVFNLKSKTLVSQKSTELPETNSTSSKYPSIKE